MQLPFKNDIHSSPVEGSISYEPVTDLNIWLYILEMGAEILHVQEQGLEPA